MLFGTDRSAMVLHHLAHVGQPQSEAFHIVDIPGGHTIEPVKNFFQVFFFDTDTIVFDRDNQFAVFT